VVETQPPKTEYDAACRRFLIQISGYTYITDVDMMILREDVPLSDFHLGEMRASGLPYSNTMRGREARGDKRMTGLHFVSPEWWPATRIRREAYLHKLDDGTYGQGRYDDELMLMDLCRACGPLPPKRRLLDRHHGIHLGTLRSYRNSTIQTRKEQLRVRISAKRSRQWQELCATREYRSIEADIRRRSRAIVWELDELFRYTAGRAREAF
jgi:hypothetical protein